MKYIHWHYSKASICLINISVHPPNMFVTKSNLLWELALDEFPRACTKMHFLHSGFLVVKFDKSYKYWQNSYFLFIITLRTDLI